MKIAEEYGLEANAEIEETGAVLPSITQLASETDAEFIADLARAEGFQFFIDSSGLHFHRKNYAQEPIAELVYYSGDGAGDFIDFHVEEDSKAKKGSVTAKGRDPATKKNLGEVGANETTEGRPTLGTNQSLYAGAVDQTTGQITERLAAPPARAEVSPSSAKTQAAAKRDAVAGYLKTQHEALKLKITIVGNTKVSARRIVKVSNIGKRLSGPWYVDKCVNRPSAGFVQHLECSRDTHNGYADPKKDVKTTGVPNKKDVKTDQVEAKETGRVDQDTGRLTTVYKAK